MEENTNPNIQNQMEGMQSPGSDNNDNFIAQRDSERNNRNLCNQFASTLRGKVVGYDGDLCQVSRSRNFRATLYGRPSKAVLDMSFSYESMDNRGRTLNLAELVLRQGEVQSVASAVRNQGLDITALHNHWMFDNPNLMYMHVSSVEDPGSFAQKMQRVMRDLG